MTELSDILIDFYEASRLWIDNNEALTGIITVVGIIVFLIMTRSKNFGRHSGTTEGGGDC